MTSKSDAESPFAHVGDGTPLVTPHSGERHPNVPDIPESCWPPCKVCEDNPTVESVRFMKPRSWREKDILTIEMMCHGQRCSSFIA